MTGVVVWMTGRPASGKTTLAHAVDRALRARGSAAVILDSDEVRAAIVPAFGYDDEGRDHFYATLANLAALFASQSHVVLVPATAGRSSYRARARAIAPAFIEVYVDTDVETCAARDPKGLYAKARSGRAATLPGVGGPYEAPADPDVVAPAGVSEEAVAAILARLEQLDSL